jgi:hypothetical protein
MHIGPGIDNPRCGQIRGRINKNIMGPGNSGIAPPVPGFQVDIPFTGLFILYIDEFGESGWIFGFMGFVIPSASGKDR